MSPMKLPCQVEQLLLKVAQGHGREESFFSAPNEQLFTHKLCCAAREASQPLGDVYLVWHQEKQAEKAALQRVLSKMSHEIVTFPKSISKNHENQ